MRYSRTLLVLALLATLFAAWHARRLRLESRLLEILPDSPAAADYRSLVEDFGGLENLYVTVGVAGRQDIERAADAAHALCEFLRASELVAAARCGLTEEDERFWFEEVLPRAPFLVPESAVGALLERLEPTSLRLRIAGARARLAGPLGQVEGAAFAADPLGLAETLEFGPHAAGNYDPLLDVFVSRSGRRVLVVVLPIAPEIDSEGGKRLVELLDRGFADLRHEYGSDLELAALGGPVYAAHDATIIRADVVGMAIGSSVLVLLLLAAYFGGLKLPLILGIVIGVAILWTAALVQVIWGGLTVFGISFAAILVGLGVDHGIHSGGRFRELLGDGLAPSRALTVAMRSTGPAILVSATTTVVAFLALTRSTLEPVRELGGIIALGMGAVLATSIAVGAPLVLLFHRGPTPPSWLWRRVNGAVEAVVGFAHVRARLVLAVAALATVLALFAIPTLEFSGDLQSLRPDATSLEAIERSFADEFGLGLDSLQVVVEGADLDIALERAERIDRAVEARGDGMRMQGPSDFLVAGATAARRAKRLREQIDPALPDMVRGELMRNGFDLEPFARALAVLDDLVAGRSPRGPDLANAPDWIRRFVSLGPDRVRIQLQAIGGTSPADVRAAGIRALDPEARVVAVSLIGGELRAAITDDFMRLAGIAALAVCLVVLISFRGQLFPSALALLPAAAGSLWLLGLYAVLRTPLDPLSVAVTPVLLGIGIDDGLHALHGARGHGGMTSAIRIAGRGMTATTLTTCAAFGSLTLSRVPALGRAGVLVAAGTLLCLVATLTLLPALDAVIGSRRSTGPTA